MFEAIFTAVITICHLYVFWRATSIPLCQRAATRTFLTALGIILWLLFVTGLIYGRRHDTTLAYWLEMGGMTWMGSLFLLTSGQLAVELLTGGGWLFPRVAPPLRGFALAVGLILSGIALHQGIKAPEVDNFEVRMAELPAPMDGTVVVAMSDLHLGSLIKEDWLAARISQVRDLHPDLVLLVGDVFDGHGVSPTPQVIQLLHTLTAPLGVWGVLGNHEFYGGPQSIRALEDGGVRLLRNSWAEVKPGLVLAGIEENTFSDKPEKAAGLIAKALSGRPPGATILLSHRPRQAADKAAEKGVGLMLAGHTHGGQIWPFNYLVERFFPMLAGRYAVEGMPVLVCRGTGTWGARMRLWQPGEIMKITLRAGINFDNSNPS